MPKISRKAFIIFACVTVVVVAGALIAYIMASNPTKPDEYNFGNDVIKSITAVIGEREVVSASVQNKNGVTTKTYKYASDSAQEDLKAYLNYLRTDGEFTIINDRKIDETTSRIDLGKESLDDGKVINMTIDYSASDYTIVIQKRVGTVRIY